MQNKSEITKKTVDNFDIIDVTKYVLQNGILRTGT